MGVQFGEMMGNQAWALKRVPAPVPPAPQDFKIYSHFSRVPGSNPGVMAQQDF